MKHTLKYGSAFLSLLLMFVFCSHQLALAGEVKYKYDPTGKVKLVKHGDQQYEYHYDGNGNLLKKQNKQKLICWKMEILNITQVAWG